MTATPGLLNDGPRRVSLSRNAPSRVEVTIVTPGL